MFKLALAAVTGMPHCYGRRRARDAIRGCGGIIADGNDPRWAQEANQHIQDLFTSSPLRRVVLAICEWRIWFVWVEREYVPEKDPSVDLIEHPPDHSRSTLGHGFTDRWAIYGEIPTL